MDKTVVRRKHTGETSAETVITATRDSCVRETAPPLAGRGGPFNNGYRDNWLGIWKKINLGPYTTPHTEIHSRWTNGLHVRSKCSKENMQILSLS